MAGQDNQDTQQDPSGGAPPQTNSVNPWLGILATLGSAYAGNRIASNAMSNAIPPEVSQLLQMSAQRAAYQNPMFQATTQGMYSMLPGFAKQGTQLNGSLPNAVPAPTSGGGGMNPLAAAALGAAGGGLAQSLLGGNGASSTFDLNKVAAAIKKLFSGGGNANGIGNPYTFVGPTNPNEFTGPVQSFQDWLTNNGYLSNPEQGPSTVPTLPGLDMPPQPPSGLYDPSGPSDSSGWGDMSDPYAGSF